jgi:hypothetical protein
MLTCLGIVIGIAAVIAMMELGGGSSRSIQQAPLACRAPSESFSAFIRHGKPPASTPSKPCATNDQPLETRLASLQPCGTRTY